MIELVSVHIPKTAGSSFFKILLGNYGDSLNLVKDSNNLENSMIIQEGLRAIHGHFYAKKYLDIFPDSKWIAWVRHPVYRLISYYNHLIYNSRLSIGNFEDFIKKDDKINQQSLYLEEKKLVDYFFIGIQEFWDEDIIELSKLMGWSTPNSVRRNTNKNLNYQEEIFKFIKNNELVKKIINLNERDMDLYYEIVALRAKRRKENLHYQHWLITKYYSLPLSDHEYKKQDITNYKLGNGEVKILNVILMNNKLQEAHDFHTGDQLIISVSLEFFNKKEDIIVGFLIQDESGNDVFGTNTSLLYRLIPFNPEDTTAEIKFSVNLNIDFGVYFLTIASHSHDGVNYDWIDSCKKFNVIKHDPRYAKNYFDGTTLLPAKVSITSNSLTACGSNEFSSNSLSSGIECWLWPSIEVLANRSFIIPITVINTGGDLWDSSAEKNPVFASYHLLDENYNIVKFDNARTPFPEPILPGERSKIDLNIDALAECAKYIIDIDLVKEGVCWFKKSIYVLVTVKNDCDNSLHIDIVE